MQTEISTHLHHFMSALPSHSSFSGWLKQFSPLLNHLSSTRNEMILSQYLYSLVNYSNQVSLKYFALIDYLLQTSPSFVGPLETIIQPTFVKAYVCFHHNGRMGDAEQMRLLRLRWRGKFSPHILNNMRLGIWNWIHVDIDVDAGSNGYRKPSFVPRTQNINPLDTFGKRRVENSHNHLHPTKRRFIEGKRDFESTQESTNIAPTKAEIKLKKLNEMTPHKCKMCGMRFGSKKNLENHQKQEIKENIKKLKQSKLFNNLIVRQSCLSVSKWENPLQLQTQQRQYYFFLDEFKYQNAECSLCCQEFEVKQLKEQERWAYINCCQVITDGKDCAMHKTCFDILNSSQENKQKKTEKMITL